MLQQNKTTRTAKSPSVVIGIDPDAEKNGVAYFDRETKQLETSALTFPDTLDYLRYIHSQARAAGRNVIVIIEAGWMNKTHWHITPFDNKQKCAKIGNDVGRNHETGRKIAEMCQHWEIPHKLIKPLQLKVGGVNLWKGKDGKITAQELKEITGLTGRTNQEQRDAALLAWTWAGEPLKRIK